MVKAFLWIGFLVVSFLHAESKDIKVTLKLDKVIFSETSDITGIIDIQHNAEDVINTNNFMAEGKLFPVEFIKKVTIDDVDSPLAVSFYKFQRPPQPVGLYLFPSVEIKINSKTYKTAPASYQVKKTLEAINPNTENFLRLASFIEGPNKIFPGQKFKLGYKIYFNNNFYLEELVLPLLNPEGFKKLSKEKISETKEGPVSIRHISIDVEAVKPGKFRLGPSYIIGVITSKGKGKKIRADAEDIVIQVSDFPSQNKPLNFSGSLGEDLSFEVSTQGLEKIYIGDKITLLLTFRGNGDLTKIKLPELCCLPGFSGYFKIGDLPPLSKEEGQKIDYLIDIKPLNERIKEIPSIEFSYFNPKEEKYYTLKSNPIPIVVLESTKEKINEKKIKKEEFLWPNASLNAKPLEIRTIYPLNKSDLKGYIFGSWETMWIIPLGFTVILLQLQIKKKRQKKEINKEIHSEDILEIAKKKESISSLINSLQEAFLLKLFELGLIPSFQIAIEDLPKEGILGEVRSFFLDLEKKHFSGKFKTDKNLILAESEILFNKLKGKL